MSLINTYFNNIGPGFWARHYLAKQPVYLITRAEPDRQTGEPRIFALPHDAKGTLTGAEVEIPDPGKSKWVRCPPPPGRDELKIKENLAWLANHLMPERRRRSGTPEMRPYIPAQSRGPLYQTIMNAGPGCWVRNTRGPIMLHRVIDMEMPSGPAPLFGSPAVIVDSYGPTTGKLVLGENRLEDPESSFWVPIGQPAWSDLVKLRAPAADLDSKLETLRSIDKLTRNGGDWTRAIDPVRYPAL